MGILQFTKSIVALTAALILNTNAVKAQVTIGSLEEPPKGALLQLSEGAVTKRGLGLPRITLTEGGSMVDIDPNNPQRPNTDDHIGLIVYNVPEDIRCPILPAGIFVWDGDEWQSLNPNAYNPEVLKDVDQDGNVFHYRKFGDAGYWMVENLRAITYADGSPAPVLSARKSDNTERKRHYAYPGNEFGLVADGTIPYWFNLYPSIGLLYNWYAASNNDRIIPGQSWIVYDQRQKSSLAEPPSTYEVETLYETAPGEKDGKIQGICPNGWYLPSARDWTRLEKELYTKAYLYSEYTPVQVAAWTPWATSWETHVGTIENSSNSTEGHGLVMKTSCRAPQSHEQMKEGKSLPYTRGGFQLFLAGVGNAEGNEKVSGYGIHARLWTSSSTGVKQGLYASSGANATGVLKSNVNYDYQFSVRCKKR